MESEVIATDIKVIAADTEVIAIDTNQKGNKGNLLIYSSFLSSAKFA